MTATGCLACAGEEITRARLAGEDPDPARVGAAVTWAPSAQVAPAGPQVLAGLVAVPSCLRHLQPDAPASRSGLAVAQIGVR